MTMPFYASAEQIMRDRSEYARKGIARGRGVVAIKFAGGVLFVAENPSNALHKVGEIYDRIGFAAAGRYNEYENLRVAGVRYADMTGYANSRRDVNGRAIANAYSQTLGAIFTEQQKPYEVEICVAEVGRTPDTDQLYRLTYDGSITDEAQFAVMGGQSDAIGAVLRSAYCDGMELEVAVRAAVSALRDGGGDGNGRKLGSDQLEVALLDRGRAGRTFRRLRPSVVAEILAADHTTGDDAAPDAPATGDESIESTSADTEPAESTSADTEPAESTSADTEAAESASADTEPAESGSADGAEESESGDSAG